MRADADDAVEALNDEENDDCKLQLKGLNPKLRSEIVNVIAKHSSPFRFQTARVSDFSDRWHGMTEIQ